MRSGQSPAQEAPGATPLLLISSEQEGNNGSRRNGATVRRGYEAFNKSDMKTLTEMFDENASSRRPASPTSLRVTREAWYDG